MDKDIFLCVISTIERVEICIQNFVYEHVKTIIKNIFLFKRLWHWRTVYQNNLKAELQYYF